MKLSVPIQTVRIMAKQTALLDSGATENFISHRTWRALGIGRQQLDKSIPVHNKMELRIALEISDTIAGSESSIMDKRNYNDSS
jgi:hypothetical protein